MDQTHIKAATRLRDEMASPSPPSPIFFRGISHPISTVPLWQSCALITKAGKTTPKTKSFKELLSRLDQRSQLAAPRYADSTKLMNGTLDSVCLLSDLETYVVGVPLHLRKSLEDGCH